MSVEDEARRIVENHASFKVDIQSLEGTEVHKGANAFVLIIRNPDGSTEWYNQGANSFEVSGLLDWALRQERKRQDSETGDMPDDE